MSDHEGAQASPHVVVLGGGCAGALASAAAIRRGCRVTVVRKGGGATALSSGAVDVADSALGDVPGQTAPALAAAGGWDVGMARIRRQRPRHPYARLGDVAERRMVDALELLDEVAEGLEFTRLEGRNLVVATELGTVKRTAMAQAATALDLVGAMRIVIVDLEDLGSFHGPSIAQTLKWISGLAGDDVDVDLVTVPRVLEGRPLTSRQLAGRLEHDAVLASFADAIADAVEEQASMATAILMPAVLGVAEHSKARSALEDRLEVAVHEMLAMPPSAPGARLVQALERGMIAAGATLISGEAKSAEVSEQVDAILVETEGGEERLEPDAVVLATGRFLAGGLVRDGDAREQVFGLPIVADGQSVGDRFIGELTDDRPQGDHLIFRAGVPWDDQLRPRAEHGGAFAANLFAAGSVLEGYDPARDGSGLGVAALTGLLAGEAAAFAATERFSSAASGEKVPVAPSAEKAG